VSSLTTNSITRRDQIVLPCQVLRLTTRSYQPCSVPISLVRVEMQSNDDGSLSPKIEMVASVWESMGCGLQTWSADARIQYQPLVISCAGLPCLHSWSTHRFGRSGGVKRLRRHLASARLKSSLLRTHSMLMQTTLFGFTLSPFHMLLRHARRHQAPYQRAACRALAYFALLRSVVVWSVPVVHPEAYCCS
jgi:hypothetical protein